jgi:carboxypeptidase C (cathepsin A)
MGWGWYLRHSPGGRVAGYFADSVDNTLPSIVAAIMGYPTRVQVHKYPGGHMYYARPASSLALRKDVMEMVAKHR